MILPFDAVKIDASICSLFIIKINKIGESVWSFGEQVEMVKVCEGWDSNRKC